MKLSIVIPAHNEEDCLPSVINDIVMKMGEEKIDYEILVVNDHSVDRTPDIVREINEKYPKVILLNNSEPRGFGRAVKEGLRQFSGEAVVITMGDASDDPDDIVKYYREIEKGYDCVFGSRFLKESLVKDYPFHKLMVNRLANYFIKVLFMIPHNDITNAFKAFRRHVIEDISPVQASYFNITVELPLKAIIRGYRYATVPINWYGRKAGVSKLHIQELARKYLFTVLYVWLEKILLKDEIRH